MNTGKWRIRNNAEIKEIYQKSNIVELWKKQRRDSSGPVTQKSAYLYRYLVQYGTPAIHNFNLFYCFVFCWFFVFTILVARVSALKNKLAKQQLLTTIIVIDQVISSNIFFKD